MIFLSLLAFPSLQYHAHLFSRTEIVFTFCQVTVEKGKETKSNGMVGICLFFLKKNSFLCNMVQGVLHLFFFSTTVYVYGGKVIYVHTRAQHIGMHRRRREAEKRDSRVYIFFFVDLLLLTFSLSPSCSLLFIYTHHPSPPITLILNFSPPAFRRTVCRAWCTAAWRGGRTSRSSRG